MMLPFRGGGGGGGAGGRGGRPPYAGRGGYRAQTVGKIQKFD